MKDRRQSTTRIHNTSRRMQLAKDSACTYIIDNIRINRQGVCKHCMLSIHLVYVLAVYTDIDILFEHSNIRTRVVNTATYIYSYD
jgi:hypothetical protein